MPGFGTFHDRGAGAGARGQRRRASPAMPHMILDLTGLTADQLARASMDANTRRCHGNRRGG